MCLGRLFYFAFMKAFEEQDTPDFDKSVQAPRDSFQNIAE